MREGLGRVGARPRRAASLRGELEALRRDSDAGPEVGEIKFDKEQYALLYLQ